MVLAKQMCYYAVMDTQMPPTDPPRKRGAPKGNRNAYKHGFYSSRPKVKELLSPNSGNCLQPDIDFYRTILRRISAAVSDPSLPPLTLEENLAALNLVCIAVARLNGLWRTNARLFSGGTRNLFATLRRLGFTKDQLDVENFVKEKSSQGGQPGNTNALKYGLYSRAMTPADAACLEATRDTAMEDELTLVRVMLRRVAESLSKEPPAEFRKHLRALNLVNAAIQVIIRLERSRMLAVTLPAFDQMEQYLETVDRFLSPPAAPSGE